jgi:hypothetical protein
MSTADAVFNQADANHDNRLDLNEFRNLVGTGGVSTNVGAADLSGLGGAGGYSSYQSSSYESSGGALGAGLSGANLVGGGYGGAYGAGAGYGGNASYGAGYGAGAGAGYGGASSYESYSSSVGNAGADLGAVGGSVQYVDAGSSSASYGAQSTAVQTYETDAQGLFRDHNPQVIRRPAPGGGVTYTQNIRVRFLQPPPVPPHGPLVIREVRPVQPPVPPPLRIRQQAPPLPTPPPLVLRERPPVPPVPVAAQTVVRRLAAVPVPPRSVVIERLPALPPRPRDIVIERWVPYGALAKRRTVVQRAGAAVQYARPRNVIIQYEQPQARIVRQFQRLGVTAENPSAYVQRYGISLLEASTLVQQARAAGVVEDISPPQVAGVSYFAQSSGNLGLAGGVVDAGYAGFGGASGYQASSVATSVDASGLGLAGGEYVSGGYGGGEYVSGGEYASGAEYVSGGQYLSGGLGGASSYESSSYSTSGAVGGGADALFNAADANQDGVLSRAEFQSAGF